MVAIAILTFAVARSASAATCIWNGTAATFSTGSGWNCAAGTGNGPPGSADTAQFDGTSSNACSIGSSVSISQISLNTGYGGTVTASASVTLTGNLTVNAGTFTSGSSILTIGGNLALGGGTFNASSVTTTIGGVFNKTGGTFGANAGTVAFTSNSSVSHTFGGATLANLAVGLSGSNGLVGYWKLDDTASPAIDSSSSGNNGTWSGSGLTRVTSGLPSVTGDVSALSFDGSNGFVTLGTSNLPANNATQSVSAWFKYNGMVDGNNHNIIAMSNLSASSAVQVGYRGSSLIAWTYGGGTLVSTTGPTDGNWHHVAYTYDGTSDRIYLDGTLMTTTTSTHQTSTPTSAYLGTYDGSNEKWNGSLDDIRVYTRAISAYEITLLAQGTSPSTTTATHTFSDPFVSSGYLSILAGTVTGSSTLSVGGSWSNAGTYSDTGTVTLTGTSASGTITSGGGAFSALTINGTGGSYTLQDNLSVTGNLTITAGTLTGTKAITVGGNWSNAGSYTNVGVVTLTSTSPSATITSGGGRFSALTVNGTGGTYTIQDRLWVPSSTITLTNGTLNGGSGSAVIHVGAFSFGSGSFVPNTSTVVFDGTSSQSLPASLSSYSGLRLEDPVETNLVGYWKLDEGQGSVLQDLSGNGNSGALSTTGTTWKTGAASVPGTITFDDYAAVTFDGSSGYAQLGANNVPATNAAVTISAWVNFTNVGTPTNQNMVVLSGGSNYVQLGIRSGKYTVWPSGAGTSVIGPTATTGAWHHVAYTYDGSSVDTLYIDGVATTGAFTHQIGATTAVYLGTFSPSSELLNGSLDDVRIYNVALTASQVAQLAVGRYAGTGVSATTTLSTNTTVSGLLAIDNGILNANGKTVSAGATGPTAALVNCGTYTVGSAAQTFTGGLTVQPGGTLSLASSGGSVQLASGQTLTVDGTLNASNAGATIQGVSAASYTFKVGSSASATPTVNISGLAVKNTSGGMQIGATTGATTNFTKFDNVAFSGGSGAQYLLVNAKTLFLSSTGCTFDSGSSSGTTTKAVTAAGDGTGNGETRLIFGGTKCATNWALSGTDTVCTSTAKSDDDSDGNGIADSGTASSNGAVVQFVRAAADDTAGTLVGFPSSAFDWNSFTYYSTYAAFNNASGTSATVYVRDEAGNPLYSWTDPTPGEIITGTPHWISTTVTGVTTHYLYVSVNGSSSNTGKVYRLKDTGTGTTSGTLTVDSSWATSGVFSCTCTITSDLSVDTNNVYWAATTATPAQVLMGITQASGAKISLSWPLTTPANVTTSSPTLSTQAGITTLYLGVTADLLQLAVTGTTFVQNTKPGTITGRVTFGSSSLAATNGTQRVYAGDSSGTIWAISPTNFTGTNFLWSYAAGSAITNSDYDGTSDTIQFGTSGGTVVALNAAGSGTSGSLVNTSYPFTLDVTDPITASPFYYSGIMVVGTSKGKLYFLDRNTGTVPGVKILNEYNFGSGESVSTVGFDPNFNRYMVSTSSASNDGRIYYFDLLADQTPSFQ